MKQTLTVFFLWAASAAVFAQTCPGPGECACNDGWAEYFDGREGTLLREDSFEGPLPQSWDPGQWAESGEEPVGVTSLACEGVQSMSFPLSHPDKRTELTSRGPASLYDYGRDYWFGAAVYIPSDFVADGDAEYIIQWHEIPDKHLGEDWRNSPISVFLKNGDWRVQLLGSDVEVIPDRKYQTYRNYGDTNPWLTGPSDSYLDETDRWINIVLHFVLDWSRESDTEGRFEMWKDGVKMVDYSGQIAFNDFCGPFLKTGNYKSKWGWADPTPGITTRNHYADAVRVGLGVDYDMVAPQCVSSPACQIQWYHDDPANLSEWDIAVSASPDATEPVLVERVARTVLDESLEADGRVKFVATCEDIEGETPGDFYASVRSVTAEGVESDWGEAAPFTIPDLAPETPQDIEVIIGEEEIPAAPQGLTLQ